VNLLNFAAIEWKYDNASGQLMTWVFIGILIGAAIFAACAVAPPQARRPIVMSFTFLSGLFYVLLYLWPKAVDRKPGTLPTTFLDKGSFWLDDATPVISDFANILAAFLIGIGIFALVRVHVTRLRRKAENWPFSVITLASFVVMVIVGLVNWSSTNGTTQYDSMENWKTVHYTWNFLFDGMYQQMESAMFSIIAFYILSAAYRAFRVRSIESTILLGTALIVLLSLMGLIAMNWSSVIDHATGYNASSFLNNFKLTEIKNWISSNIQDPSLRAVNFGIGVGALAMGLRLWLSLEKGGVGV